MEFDQIFNLFEGIFWILISIVLISRIRRFPKYRDLLIVGSIAFFVFGITDFIEIYTRAWYQPWFLLLLNAVCVITLFTCLALYFRRRKEAGSQQSGIDNPVKRD